MEQANSPASNTNTNNHQKPVDYNYHLKKQLAMNHPDKSFRSMNRAVPGAGRGPGLLPGGRGDIQTSHIVNRALEVMSKSLQEADYTPRKPVKSVDDGDTEDESETFHSPSDSGNSDNDETDSPASPVEPKSRLGSVTAQLSFRKIAKKRRKAGGQTSFHHTKSSKEYLRKAQEAYQRLKISEDVEQNESKSETQLESNKATLETNKTEESESIDYGYGDAAPDDKTKDEVDYGYGDPSESQPDQTVDYGYGDTSDSQPQTWRREKPKRRNSVTKFSVQAANVVAAQAHASRILKLNPNLTSLSRSKSTPATKEELEEQALQMNRRQDESEKKIPVDRFAAPRRPARRLTNDRGYDRGSVMQSPRLQVTSDYFASDAKPNNLVQRNSGRLNGTRFRFSAPSRTSSWLSNESYSMNKTDDDDDCDSLASDMESLCSIRDSSLNNMHKNTDMPPVLPNTDRRSRFKSSKSISGEFLRRPLIVSWSNGSNKNRALSRFANKSRPRSDSNDFSILPTGGRFGASSASKSKSCMPAPVRRTPSHKGAQQRQD